MPLFPVARADLSLSTRRRVAARLLPYLFTLYVVAFLDRVNVSYAAIGMSDELHFAPSQIGFGLGVFFLGYFLLEVPSAVIVEKWSARKWLARIMVVWGFVAVFTGLIHSAQSFYTCRFILGIAEAGFFPGVIVYLTHWFTERDRAKAVSVFMLAVPISYVIGSPISAAILQLRWMDLSGWRWVLILQGIPAIILGILNLRYLQDWPRDAVWLSTRERTELQLAIDVERRGKTSSLPVMGYFRHRIILTMMIILFLNASGAYGFSLWLPTIVKGVTGLSTETATLISALPYVVSAISLLLFGWNSDRTNERHWHTALPLFLSSIGLFIASVTVHNVVMSVIGMCLVGAGLYSFLPSFWALPGQYLSRTAAAVAAGLINCVGSLGGFVGPYLLGYVKSTTHSFSAAMLVLSGFMCVAGILVFSIGRHNLGSLKKKEYFATTAHQGSAT